jgi:hypothetical protein
VKKHFDEIPQGKQLPIGVPLRHETAGSLTLEDRALLQTIVQMPTIKEYEIFRAGMVLLAAEGRSTAWVARKLSTTPRGVNTWRDHVAREKA